MDDIVDDADFKLVAGLQTRRGNNLGGQDDLATVAQTDEEHDRFRHF